MYFFYLFNLIIICWNYCQYQYCTAFAKLYFIEWGSEASGILLLKDNEDKLLVRVWVYDRDNDQITIDFNDILHACSWGQNLGRVDGHNCVKHFKIVAGLNI